MPRRSRHLTATNPTTRPQDGPWSSTKRGLSRHPRPQVGPWSSTERGLSRKVLSIRMTQAGANLCMVMTKVGCPYTLGTGAGKPNFRSSSTFLKKVSLLSASPNHIETRGLSGQSFLLGYLYNPASACSTRTLVPASPLYLRTSFNTKPKRMFVDVEYCVTACQVDVLRWKYHPYGKYGGYVTFRLPWLFVSDDKTRRCVATAYHKASVKSWLRKYQTINCCYNGDIACARREHERYFKLYANDTASIVDPREHPGVPTELLSSWQESHYGRKA